MLNFPKASRADLRQELKKMKISRGLVALSILIAVAIFIFDVMTPKGVAAAVPYVGLILLSRRSKYPPYAFIFAGVATVLTVIGFFLSPDGPVRIDLADRGLAIFAIWLTASLCYQHIEMVLQLDSANKELKKQVVDTVSETVQAVADLQSERAQRKQTEEELQEELQDVEGRFAAIFNQTFQLIAVLDREGRIEEANDTFMMACGQQRHEIQGKPIWSLDAIFGNGNYQDRLRRAVEAAESGDFSRTEIGFADANQTKLTMDASIKPIRDTDSNIYSLIFEARDITEEKQSQELLHQAQKTEVIGQLTSGVAHDFNNILAIIGGHLEISTGTSQTDENRREHVERALDTVFRGRELTQQLLAFSRKRQLERQPVDTDALIDSSLKLIDRTLMKEVDIVTDLEDPTWFVLSDPGELQTAILNLVVNSRDAMEDGGTITIKTANQTFNTGVRLPDRTLEAGDYVLLSVVDEGSGVAPELLDRITEPYFTTKAQGAGTGLGLSMVNQFARQTGGAMHVASTVGMGTTVTIYLPRSDGPKAPESVDRNEETESSNDGADKRILVVEDDHAVRKNVVTMLSELGYAVEEVDNGADALALLKDGMEFDLVFSDIALPGAYDGRDLAQEIVEMNRNIKVLLTTGVPDHAKDAELERVGIPILAKPYRYAELAKVINAMWSA
jgi:PAS domain S-box-containing protein